MKVVVLSLSLFFTPLYVLASDVQPEDTLQISYKKGFIAHNELVVAAHPLAAKAGFEIIKSGGNAIDAMVAVQMMLNLVEPQSSGLGGGAFLLYHDAQSKRLISTDGREMAPKSSQQTMFYDPAGNPRRWMEVVPGGLSVGVPGTLALMKHAHMNYGSLPWHRLFELAIKYSEEGFVVSPRLAGALEGVGGQRLSLFEESRKYFFPQGKPLVAGQTLRNEDFADTLRQISTSGIDSFYTGEIASDIVKAVQHSPVNPGILTLDDLAMYRVVEREPVCIAYRGYKVCGMGPPSSGGIAVAQMLGILEHFNLRSLGVDNPVVWHLFVEAGKLAYADRNMYVADDDFTQVPIVDLLDKEYLRSRAAVIDFHQALEVPVDAGPIHLSGKLFPDTQDELPGTSHVSIRDKFGNAVSLTTTIESGFGSGLFVRGFLLNNEMTDFSFAPSKKGRLVSNRIQPSKRPRSSMAPTIIYGPDGQLKFILGSPGGSRIISYVAQAIIGLIDFDLSPQESANLGKISSRNGSIDLEMNTAIAEFGNYLEAKGNKVIFRDLNSGLHIIEDNQELLIGGADPRREGVGLGR